MTNEEKKERRKLRHKLQKAVIKEHYDKDFKSIATSNQMKQFAKKIADSILAGKNVKSYVRL